MSGVEEPGEDALFIVPAPSDDIAHLLMLDHALDAMVANCQQADAALTYLKENKCLEHPDQQNALVEVQDILYTALVPYLEQAHEHMSRIRSE